MGLNNYNSRGDNKRLKTRGLLSSPGTSYIHPPDSWVAREKEESPKKDSFHVLLVAGASLVAQGCKKTKNKKQKTKKKKPACNAGDVESIPGPGRSPGEGNGNPLQYSCVEAPWAEEPGGLQSSGLESIGLYTKATEH